MLKLATRVSRSSQTASAFSEGGFKERVGVKTGFSTQTLCHAARCEIFTTVVDSASDSLESL
jgi:hypothetical protein